MARKRKHFDKRPAARPYTPAASAPERQAPAERRRTPVQYDKPLILLEDANKDTFEFKVGQWAPHGMTIAQCRENCLVKQLPQKVNGMTRYEVRYPMSSSE